VIYEKLRILPNYTWLNELIDSLDQLSMLHGFPSIEADEKLSHVAALFIQTALAAKKRAELAARKDKASTTVYELDREKKVDNTRFLVDLKTFLEQTAEGFISNRDLRKFLHVDSTVNSLYRDAVALMKEHGWETCNRSIRGRVRAGKGKGDIRKYVYFAGWHSETHRMTLWVANKKNILDVQWDIHQHERRLEQERSGENSD
jgi:hypothetical protein